MALQKDKLKEAFMIIVIAVILGTLAGYIAILANAETRELAPAFASSLVSGIAMGIVIISVVALLIHIALPSLSALILVIVAYFAYVGTQALGVLNLSSTYAAYALGGMLVVGLITIFIAYWVVRKYRLATRI